MATSGDWMTTLGGGYSIKLEPHPLGKDSDVFRIVFDDKNVGYVTVYHYDEPAVADIRVDEGHRNLSLGRKSIRALVSYYGSITSDPQGNTSPDAIKMWQSVGAEKVPTNKNTKGYMFRLSKGATGSVSKKPFFSDCVSWPENADALDEIRRNGLDLERDEFLSFVDFNGDPDVAIPEDDWHIRYYKYEGGPIYFYVHSGIEHVYADYHDIKAVVEKVESEYAESSIDPVLIRALASLVKASRTMTLWHGGNLDQPEDMLQQKGGRWEYGPGLYLITTYSVAQKYAKGSRKLYRVTVGEGNDISDVSIPEGKVKDFLSSYCIKSKRKEVDALLSKYMANGQVAAENLLIILINLEAIKSTNTPALRSFLVENGVDYWIVKNAFGFSGTMLVLFNMKKIVKAERMSGQKIEVFDLPPDFS